MSTPRDGSARRYDVAVVGAGGAGCEAARRLAQDGFDVLLVTTSLDTVFAAPEGRVSTDVPPDSLAAALLPSLTVADDGTVGSWELHAAAKYLLEASPTVHLLQSNVDALRVAEGAVHGVDTWEGVPRAARAVALCVGPFLRARLTIGDAVEHAGRPGEMAYDELAADLEAHGVSLRPVEDRGGGRDGRPAWTLRTVRIAEQELDGPRIARLRGLYAAGTCVSGPLGYAEAAAAGRALAQRVAADLGAADD